MKAKGSACSIAVEIVALDDAWATSSICVADRRILSATLTKTSEEEPRTFVCRAIRCIVATLDARPVRAWFYELDVVLVSQALAALGVALATRSTARVVLTTFIMWVQPRQMAGPDAARHCSSRLININFRK